MHACDMRGCPQAWACFTESDDFVKNTTVSLDSQQWSVINHKIFLSIEMLLRFDTFYEPEPKEAIGTTRDLSSNAKALVRRVKTIDS